MATKEPATPKPIEAGNEDREERQRCGSQIQLSSKNPLMGLMSYTIHRLRDDLTAAIKAAFSKQEQDARTRFHEQFKKEADEYDKDFHKNYHDDLNSTLIFVRYFRLHIEDLTDRLVVRSLVCGCIRLHPRRSITDAPRLQPNELHCAHHASERNVGDTKPRSTTYLARCKSVYCPSPVNTLCFPPECFARCAPGNVGKTMAEPPHPGSSHRPQSPSRSEDEGHDRLASWARNGMLAFDRASFSLPVRVRVGAVFLEYQSYGLLRHSWVRRHRRSPVPLDGRCRDVLKELSLPDSDIRRHSRSPGFPSREYHRSLQDYQGLLLAGASTDRIHRSPPTTPRFPNCLRHR